MLFLSLGKKINGTYVTFKLKYDEINRGEKYNCFAESSYQITN